MPIQAVTVFQVVCDVCGQTFRELDSGTLAPAQFASRAEAVSVVTEADYPAPSRAAWQVTHPTAGSVLCAICRWIPTGDPTVLPGHLTPHPASASPKGAPR